MLQPASPGLAPATKRPSLPWQGQGIRRTALALGLAVLLAAGAWFLIGQVANYRNVLHAVDRAHPGWLAVALAAALAGYVGFALTYQAFAGVGGGPRAPFRLVLRLTVGVFAASVIATAAGRLGSEYWSLRRLGERPPVAWSRVLGLETAAWALLAALACVGALVLVASGGRGGPFEVELAWLLALPVCSVPALYLTAPGRDRLWADAGGRPRRTLAAALRGLVLVRWVLRSAEGRRRGLGGGLIYWGGELLTVWAALRAFGVELGPGALLVAYATGYVSTMLPLPAGGAGSVDAASTFALTLVGVPLGPALLATLVQRLCTYWLPLLVAVLRIRSLRRLGGDLETVARRRESAAQRELLPEVAG